MNTPPFKDTYHRVMVMPVLVLILQAYLGQQMYPEVQAVLPVGLGSAIFMTFICIERMCEEIGGISWRVQELFASLALLLIALSTASLLRIEELRPIIGSVINIIAMFRVMTWCANQPKRR